MVSSASDITDLCSASAAMLARHYADGSISPVDVAHATLERAELVKAKLNAFTLIDHEGALAAARLSEKRWAQGASLSPVDGVPATIKDIVVCNGLDVRYGSKATSDISGEPDAPSVARMRAAGVVFLGLTVTPEFGWKAVTDNRRDGIVLNPWDVSRTPGGSSGGAAVAAACGAGVLHLGTDGGGSIRIPASFTGIVGHKPSFGRVAAFPASSFGTVAHIGPMARSVLDTSALLTVMGGRDIRDWYQPPLPFADAAPEPVSWAGKKIGYWKEPCVGTVDPSVAMAVEAVLKDLELAGALISEIRLPDQDALLEIFYRHWYVGAANRMATVPSDARSDMDPGLLDAASKGQAYSAIERMQAEIARAAYGARMDMLLNEYDLILSATVPVTAFEAGRDTPPGSPFESWVEWSSFSFPINLSQQPACSVPCGLTAAGLPVGLQIIGPRGEDAAVLSAALTIEQMYPENFLSGKPVWPPLVREAA